MGGQALEREQDRDHGAEADLGHRVVTERKTVEDLGPHL